MKVYFIIVFLFFFNLSFSQKKIDSIIWINNNKFKISASFDEFSQKELNSAITIYRNGKKILADSFWSAKFSIDFDDINQDGYKDLFIHRATGFRPNETYYLFLFRKKYNGFKKVIGFEDYPNIEKTSKKGIFASLALSGEVEYHFLRLTDNGKLIDLNIHETDTDLSGKAYDRGCKKQKKL